MSFYICSNCNYGSGSWIGKCPDCGEWNTFTEQADDDDDKKTKRETVKPFETVQFNKIALTDKKRFDSGIYEFDRVLGGGFVLGEVIVLTGEPGIGKSTLLLQALHKIRTVYVSGEETGEQVKNRATRLGVQLDNLTFSDTLQIESIIKGVESLKTKPQILVIDSIQTVYSRDVASPAGTVAQLKEVTSKLVAFGKKNNICVLIIGHVTKDGDIAGPKTLEHLVDCVLVFEGEKVSHYRVLRALKNRFGSTDEIGIFEMAEKGLAEVSNPRAFISNDDGKQEGRAVIGVSEGTRPLFFEIQVLTVPTQLSIPRRVVKGIDFNKLQLLLAVSKRYLHLPTDTLDVYVNVVGGITVQSPAADLGIIAAILSSVRQIPITAQTVFTGEVGLLGEIRPVLFQKRILQEAKRMKFSAIHSSETINSVKKLSTYFKR